MADLWVESTCHTWTQHHFRKTLKLWSVNMAQDHPLSAAPLEYFRKHTEKNDALQELNKVALYRLQMQRSYGWRVSSCYKISWKGHTSASHMGIVGCLRWASECLHWLHMCIIKRNDNMAIDRFRRCNWSRPFGQCFGRSNLSIAPCRHVIHKMKG